MKLAYLALCACSHVAHPSSPPPPTPVDPTPRVVLVPYDLAASTIDGKPIAYPTPHRALDAVAFRTALSAFDVTYVGIYNTVFDLALQPKSGPLAFEALTDLVAPLCSPATFVWLPTKSTGSSSQQVLVRDGFTSDGGIARFEALEAPTSHWQLQGGVQAEGLLLKAVERAWKDPRLATKLVANPAFMLHETVIETPGEIIHDQCAGWHAQGYTCDPVKRADDFWPDGPRKTYTRDRQPNASDITHLELVNSIASCDGAWHVTTTVNLTERPFIHDVKPALMTDTKVTVHARIDALTGAPLEHCDQ